MTVENEVGEEGRDRSHNTRKCSHLRIYPSELDTMLGEKY